MEQIDFSLNGAPHIELNKLLKTLNIAETGGQARNMILEGLIEHQGGIENRIRAKIVAGGEVVVGGELLIRVID